MEMTMNSNIAHGCDLEYQYHIRRKLVEIFQVYVMYNKTEILQYDIQII